MKIARWIDTGGYQRISIVRDDDEYADMTHGLRKGPPDITTLDWENIVRELHNALVGRNLFTYEDVLRSQNGVTSAILSTLKRRVVGLYKQQ